VVRIQISVTMYDPEGSRPAEPVTEEAHYCMVWQYMILRDPFRLERTRSLRIIYCHICLYTHRIKYKQLRTCNRRGSLLHGGVVTAIRTC